MIIIFRGKAATGKSMMAKQINEGLGAEIVSKDSIFDRLLEDGYSWDEASNIAYDKLASVIQDCHDNKKSLIVDIGLAHTEYFDNFMNKMNLKNVKKFLFTCSDDSKWESRICKRIENPEVPNQAFKSIQQAREHYEKYNIIPHDDELVIDSADSVESIRKRILQVL